MESPDKNQRIDATRRLMMKSVAGLGIAAAIPSTVAADATSHSMGTFENGLDGWRTNGRVELSRVSRSNKPRAVERGSHALSVSAEGDGFPVIRNEAAVAGQSFVDSPYLQGRILTGLTDTHSKITLVLRYHHGATPAGKQSGGNGKGSKKGVSNQKPVLVEERTTTITVPGRSAFGWDLSDLSDEKLSTPRRIELAWFAGEDPPERGPNGTQPHTTPPADVYLDAIRMTGNRDALSRTQVIGHLDDLVRTHGGYQYEAREFFENGEVGVFAFNDGTEVPVEWEELGEEKERYTIGERTFKLGGDW